VLQPFREEGVPVDFFRVRADLSIDPEHLEQQARAVRPAGVLFINYFGFPPSPEAREVLLRLRGRCRVIEDCAHGSFLEGAGPAVGQTGDFVLTSFRKYLPVPDGGLVVNRTELSLPPLPEPQGRFARYRLLAKYLRGEFLNDGCREGRLEDAYLFLFAEAERELDGAVPLEAMSAASEAVLAGTDLADVREQRRRNYAFLLRQFAEAPRLRSVGAPLLPELPPGVSPLVFPLRVAAGRRDALRRGLIARRVFCPVHWRLPEEIDPGRFGESVRLSHECLGLPIDQRYAEEDLRGLVRRLLQTWEAL
jgi:dTDP-4-amino-4,6-dideoxygalactose transaminase